jgi:4-hydroxy 2-oxovalerate aldolase
MEWTTNRAYSFNSIVRALDNKKKNIDDNAKYPIFQAKAFESVIIIGGGPSAKIHSNGVKELIKTMKGSVAIIHSTSRHIIDYQELDSQFLCLSGSEGDILAKTFPNIFMEIEAQSRCHCVLPPHPRKLGTNVPDFAKTNTYELASIDYTKDYQESCTAIALQVAALLTDKEIFVTGYDGYTDAELSYRREAELFKENSSLFSAFTLYYNRALTSLTPTHYSQMDTISLYGYLGSGK